MNSEASVSERTKAASNPKEGKNDTELVVNHSQSAKNNRGLTCCSLRPGTEALRQLLTVNWH